MKKAEAGEVALLFLDASHFVMGCDYLGHIWGTERRYLKTNSGRKRYNVLGALDFVSKRILTVSNDTYILVSNEIFCPTPLSPGPFLPQGAKGERRSPSPLGGEGAGG